MGSSTVVTFYKPVMMLTIALTSLYMIAIVKNLFVNKGKFRDSLSNIKWTIILTLLSTVLTAVYIKDTTVVGTVNRVESIQFEERNLFEAVSFKTKYHVTAVESNTGVNDTVYIESRGTEFVIDLERVNNVSAEGRVVIIKYYDRETDRVKLSLK